MASTLKVLLLKYRDEIRKQNDWKGTSKMKKIEFSRFQRFGNAFFDMVVEVIYGEEEG